MVTGSRGRTSIGKTERDRSAYLKWGRYHITINSCYSLNTYYISDMVVINQSSCLVLTIAVLVRVG